jgi:hypothetical protein
MSFADVNSASSAYFASFEVDLLGGELHRDGERLPLQQQPFRVLAQLLDREGLHELGNVGCGSTAREGMRLLAGRPGKGGTDYSTHNHTEERPPVDHADPARV